jgi:two-component system, cell cycle response regulator
MGSDNKVFRVAVIANLSEREWQILASVTRLTTSRTRAYVFGSEFDDAPDIYLVDGESPDAQARWSSARVKQSAPAVFLVTEPEVASARREIRRPLVPSCLLSLVKLFDDLTVQELHYLPELSIGQKKTVSTAAAAVVLDNKRMRFTALVVEDSPTVQAQVALGLKLFGVEADYATTAEEAYALLKQKDYDIAFLDVVLSGAADGYQICRSIKKDRRHEHMPVIMLTGKSSAFDRIRASLVGCDDFLIKPVQNDVFQKILHLYLEVQEPGMPAPEQAGQITMAK